MLACARHWCDPLNRVCRVLSWNAWPARVARSTPSVVITADLPRAVGKGYPVSQRRQGGWRPATLSVKCLWCVDRGHVAWNAREMWIITALAKEGVRQLRGPGKAYELQKTRCSSFLHLRSDRPAKGCAYHGAAICLCAALTHEVLLNLPRR